MRRRAGRLPHAPQREHRGSAIALGVSPREPDGVGGGNEDRNAQLMLELQRFIDAERAPLHRRGKRRGHNIFNTGYSQPGLSLKKVLIASNSSRQVRISSSPLHFVAVRLVSPTPRASDADARVSGWAKRP